jgi:replicative DNA helicase
MSNPNTSRVPPQAVEVEENILGSMLIDAEAAEEVLINIAPDDFYKPAHGIIYEAIISLSEKGKSADVLTVEQKLRDLNKLDECGGPGYLADLTKYHAAGGDMEYFCAILKNKSMLRQLITGNNKINKEAYEPDADAYEVLDKESALLDQVSGVQATRHGGMVKEYIQDMLDDVERAMNAKGNVTGIPTGLDIDNLTAGWQPGDLIIIAARPSMGKTALALTMAHNAAAHKDESLRSPGIVFSLEMSAKKLVGRFTGIIGDLSQSHLVSGRITTKEYENLCTEVAEKLYGLNIYLDDTPGISLRQMRQKVRRAIRKLGIKWVIIDYLQLMRSGSDKENRTQEVGQISRGLKQMAQEFDIPFIALSQLSRQVEYRSNKRPQMSDLRESGDIEQDADLICFLYRPEYYGITVSEDGSSTEGLAEIILAKQRNGPLGAPKVKFQKEYGRFVNIEHYRQESAPQPSPVPDNYRSPLPPEQEDDAPF